MATGGRKKFSEFQNRAVKREPKFDSSVGLTAREMDVLCLLARGLTYRQIASNLEVSINTVSSYVKTLYRKLGVESARAAVWEGFRNGLFGIKSNPSCRLSTCSSVEQGKNQ